ncbi:uncharacterized protein [Dysidea avara]|uniref:uncharacterized protein isoform X2 n=1 Tax=Dysidea avara TaxID=196820 RepID=UPI00331A5215
MRKSKDNQFGAVNIYNSPNVIVKNCTFYNNTSDGRHSSRPFQATGGGLSISCINGIYDSVNISISECNFTENSAKLPGTLQGQTNRVAFQSGRGGGVAIFVNTPAAVNCVVNNSVFVKNIAHEGGGGLFCFIEAQNHRTYVLENLLFVDNLASSISGALLLSTLNSRSSEAFSSVAVINCTFMENTAVSIGGVSNVYFYNGLANNSVIFRSCVFTNNSAGRYGGAVDVASYNFFVDRSHYTPVTFIDCIFDSNFGADAAAINIAYYNTRFDNVTFSNNIGNAVRVIAAKVYTDTMTYDGNSAAGTDIVSEGGAFHLFSFSQVLLHNGTHVNFVNNTGRVGAAVVVEVDPPVIPPVFRNINGHSLCFLQYSDPSVPFESLNPNHTSINFMDNEAIVGRDVYAGVELCPWLSPPQGLSFISYDSREEGVLPLLTPAQTMELYNESVRAYPGEIVKIQMIPKDQLNQTTLGIVTLELSRNSVEINNDDAYFSFSPTARVLHPQSLSYNVSYTIGTIDNVVYVNRTFLIMVELFRSPDQNSSFNLTVTPCPAGLVLHTVESLSEVKEYECKCNRGQDENIAECVPDEKRLILKERLWAININTGESLNGMMEYYQCPPGYCQCSREDDGGNICNSVYHYDNDDLQCVCDRQGYLCGKCRGNKGVSVLLNKCVSCGHGSIALIFGLVVVDIIVITVILLSSVTIFSWLYPVVFYLQITPYIAQYFPVTFSAVQPYLHYISSAASLYFPYDFCIYPGMTALVSYSLRYIPVLLFVIIYCCIWALSRKFPNISISWSGVWLLILLLFTDVVNTSVSILNCPILRDSDGKKSMRWFVDGTVECFSGGHAGLATFAILVLIVCTLLIIALVVVVLGKVKTIISCGQVHLRTIRLEKLLQEPFVGQYNWWAPTELIRRLMFIILIMAFPGNLDTSINQQYLHQRARVQELERQLQSLQQDNKLIGTQKQQLVEDNQGLQQKIHLQETELQNLRKVKQDNESLQQQLRLQETELLSLRHVKWDNQILQQQIHLQETELQNLRQEKHDNQSLQQQIHVQEMQFQNRRYEKQEDETLLQQQAQEIHHLLQQQQYNTLQQQQQTWIIYRNEISLKEKELGRGAYGWVKEATFRGCKVAVKCLHNELISDYNLLVFEREMTMAARCRHPNLLQFIGATNEGIPLIVTEMMQTSLRKLLENGQLSSDQIIPIAAGIACGLNYLHKTTPSPILHRDVSSANVLLNSLPDNQWLPKLSDFGSFNFMRLSQTVNAGNPVYAAPEALDPSKGPHTPAMDAFSLGVLLYEMCSRRLPTGVFNTSMLQQVNWRVPESSIIPLIAACVDQMIQKRPSMDRVITQLNSVM